MNLLTSYLSNRYQYTSFLGSDSEKLKIEYGVPQGSVLGPLLFLLYINDIVNCHNEFGCNFILYADDTNIFIIGPSKEATYVKANAVLEQVSKFMYSNSLHINMSKCCYMHFSPSNEYESTCARVRPFANEYDNSRAIYINGQLITKVHTTKFLGIIIDDKLNWHAHLEYLSKKLRSMTGAIKRMRLSIPKAYYRTIYSALFESHLNYGISIWGSAGVTCIKKLFVLQKYCIRVLFGDFDAYLDKYSTCARTREFGKQILGSCFYAQEHTKPLFTSHNIMTVHNSYTYYSIVELFKIIKFKHPIALHELIKLSQRSSSHTILLQQPSNHFLYQSSRMWNTICKHFMNTNIGYELPLSTLKNKLKGLLLNIQSLHESEEWAPSNFVLDSINISKL